MVVFSSHIPAPLDIKAAISTATSFLLTMALAALGLQTDVSTLSAMGLRPSRLARAASLFIGGFSLTLVLLTL